MGGSSSSQTQSQQSTTAPGAMTSGTVQGIVGQLNPLIANSGTTAPETAAINQLTASGQAGNPYAPQIGNNASTLLSGGGATGQNGALGDNLNTLRTTLGQYTDPNYSTVNSPEVRAALDAANADVTNQVNGQFAAAGRSGSGMNTQTLARGIAQADAPIILNQANLDTATRTGAANTLYGAGNTTSGAITGNNQTALGNEQAGTGAATSALDANNWGDKATIAAQELGKSIPASDLGMLSQIGIPLAGLNTTTNSNGTSNTKTDPSLLQDITGIGGMLGSLKSGGTSVGGAPLSGGSPGSGILGLLGML
jgi:hypothetical protein